MLGTHPEGVPIPKERGSLGRHRSTGVTSNNKDQGGGSEEREGTNPLPCAQVGLAKRGNEIQLSWPSGQTTWPRCNCPHAWLIFGPHHSGSEMPINGVSRQACQQPAHQKRGWRGMATCGDSHGMAERPGWTLPMGRWPWLTQRRGWWPPTGQWYVRMGQMSCSRCEQNRRQSTSRESKESAPGRRMSQTTQCIVFQYWPICSRCPLLPFPSVLCFAWMFACHSPTSSPLPIHHSQKITAANHSAMPSAKRLTLFHRAADMGWHGCNQGIRWHIREVLRMQRTHCSGHHCSSASQGQAHQKEKIPKKKKRRGCEGR